jgi:uncharacterized protein YndB with AHSA1/START domain
MMTIRVRATVSAPVDAVYDAWSTSLGAEGFFASKANIDQQIGGPYEIWFNPADERMSTKGCKLLSYVPREMISFQWRLPGDEFPELRDATSWVVVQLRPSGPYVTDVTITHLGLGDGPAWDRAYSHMRRGWDELAVRLQRRFVRGPVDWEAQAMMWKERAAG